MAITATASNHGSTYRMWNWTLLAFILNTFSWEMLPHLAYTHTRTRTHKRTHAKNVNQMKILFMALILLSITVTYFRYKFYQRTSHFDAVNRHTHTHDRQKHTWCPRSVFVSIVFITVHSVKCEKWANIWRYGHFGPMSIHTNLNSISPTWTRYGALNRTPPNFNSKSIFYLFSLNFRYSIKIDSNIFGVSVLCNTNKLDRIFWVDVLLRFKTNQYNTYQMCNIICSRRRRKRKRRRRRKRKEVLVLWPHRIISSHATNFHLHIRMGCTKEVGKKLWVIISIFFFVEIERLQVKSGWNGTNGCLIAVIRLCVCVWVFWDVERKKESMKNTANRAVFISSHLKAPNKWFRSFQQKEEKMLFLLYLFIHGQ